MGAGVPSLHQHFRRDPAEPCGVTHKTAFLWRHRVLATESGYQDRIVLRDTVWVDETHINGTDLSKGYGQARKRGLSRQKLCICVNIDVHKNPVAVVCGHGKPSSACMRKAVGGRIAPGSLLIHGIERAHGALCRSTRTARGSSSRSSPTPTRGSRW